MCFPFYENRQKENKHTHGMAGPLKWHVIFFLPYIIYEIYSCIIRIVEAII